MNKSAVEQAIVCVADAKIDMLQSKLGRVISHINQLDAEKRTISAENHAMKTLLVTAKTGLSIGMTADERAAILETIDWILYPGI